MADLHPMAWADETANWMGESLRAAAPKAKLVSDTRALRPGDWLVVRPGQQWPLERILGAAMAGEPGGLVVDSVDRPAVEQWLMTQPTQRFKGALGVRDLPRLAKRMGHLASAFYGHPSRQMAITAVTGTNGKSTVVHLLAQAWARLGHHCASIGTLGVRSFHPDSSQREWAEPGLTSWDAVSLHGLLEALLQAGVTHVAMEASSIGLAQYRLAGCRLHAAAFTSLGSDHLDVHGTLQAYGAAKALLFEQPGLEHVVVAAPLRPLSEDDPLWAGWAPLQHAVDALPASALTRVAVEHSSGRIHLSDPEVSGLSLSWQVRDRQTGEQTRCLLPMGRHNAQNAAVVLGLLVREGRTVLQASHALEGARTPNGRLTPVQVDQPGRPAVFVDYAHTADGIEQICDAVSPLVKARCGRLVIVFGCGGDRDRSKRPLMGQAAGARADRLVVTSDNPRSESSERIIEDILAGLSSEARQRTRVESDRGAAIRLAVGTAGPRDVVVIAGKGHEQTQIIQGVALPFCDATQAEAALEAYASPMTLMELSLALNGARQLGLAMDDQVQVESVSTDSRQVRPGTVFFALVGAQHNGHAFLEDVAERGAVAVVVSETPVEAVLSRIPVFQVPDTRVALGEMAGAWRQRFRGQVWAVTGSNGKTTVKEMLLSIARAHVGEGRAWATPGNLNNEIGLPLSLLGLGPQHEVAVIEIGMNHPGEIKPLAQLARPNVAVVTNAQREHQAFMGTVEACARENGDVFEALMPDGIAVFPCDPAHEPIWHMQSRGHRQMRFGLVDDPALQTASEPVTVMGAWSPSLAQGPRLRMTLGSQSLDIPLLGLGRHFARNACGAATLAWAAGVSPQHILQGLSRFEPVRGRGALHRLSSGHWLVDDTYNANPDSVLAAIEALSEQPGPKAMVLGDMGEVGEQGPAFHAEALSAAAARGIDVIWLLGPAFTQASQRLQIGRAAHDSQQVVTELTHWLDEAKQSSVGTPATVWFKASRFMRLEQTLHAVIDAANPSKAPHAALSH
ncbi:MAG: bifunctional UDP-N-acetylmuramoyl-L-alanyl-D-glutamate--2,6-diaminopimelate ligase [Pseudomonadota bacterium]